MQDSHAGTEKFIAAGNLGLIIARSIVFLPFGSSNVRGFINYFMR